MMFTRQMTMVTNDKSGDPYVMIDVVTDATNARDGQRMVLYATSDLKHCYVRDEAEFWAKFTADPHQGDWFGRALGKYNQVRRPVDRRLWGALLFVLAGLVIVLGARR